jgi:hypothetical protein
MPKGIPNKKEDTELLPKLSEPVEEINFATKTEINELKDIVVKLYDIIDSQKKELQVKKEEQEKKEDQDVFPDAPPIKRKWRSIVDAVLGTDFGINVSYSGAGGMIFRVIVPRDKSNADNAYFSLYHNDVRSKVIALGGNEDEAIKMWCKKIKQNLVIKPKQV